MAALRMNSFETTLHQRAQAGLSLPTATWHGGLSRYTMLHAAHPQRAEFDEHRPVSWKHRLLPLQMKDLEKRIAQIAQAVADGVKTVEAARRHYVTVRDDVYGEKLRYKHRLQEAEWELFAARGRLTTLVSDGKRLAVLLLAMRERVREGKELGL